MTTLLDERAYVRGGIVRDVVLPVTQDSSLPETLRPGERVTFRFRASDSFWIRAWQSGQIEKRFDRHPEDFYVWSIDYNQPGILVFKIQIKGDASKLYTERRIAELISQANPEGFKLAFIESAREFTEEVLKPAGRATVNFAIVVFLAFLAWTALRYGGVAQD